MKKAIVAGAVALSLLAGASVPTYAANLQDAYIVSLSPSKLEDGSKKKSTDYEIVKKGGTLWGYSRKYYTSIESIKRVNNLKSDVIKIGQKIWIPYYRDVPGKHVKTIDDKHVVFNVLGKNTTFYCPYGGALKFEQWNFKGRKFMLVHHKNGKTFVLDTAEKM